MCEDEANRTLSEGPSHPAINVLNCPSSLPPPSPTKRVPAASSPLIVRVLRTNAERSSAALFPQRFSSYNSPDSEETHDKLSARSPAADSGESVDWRARDSLEGSRSAVELRLSSTFDSVPGVRKGSYSGAASAYLPTTTRLIERIARGRMLASKRCANTSTAESSSERPSLTLRERPFSSPKIVRVQSGHILKRTTQRPAKKTLVKNSPSKFGATDLSAAKHSDVARIFALHQFHRQIATDILLDNYRRRSKSPMRDLLVKVIRQVGPALQHHCASPMRVTCKIDTQEVRKCADQRLVGNSRFQRHNTCPAE